jgi:hypothetical protein
MTSRNSRSRRKARKERKLREREAELRAEEEHRLHPPDLGPINESRVRQIFGSTSFRSHEKGGSKPFADFARGPTVKATNPKELEERTAEAFVDATLGKPEN